MKKLILALIIGVALFATGTVKAQTGLTPIYLQGSGNNFTIPTSYHDTVIKSTNYFWVAPVNAGTWNTGVSFTLAMDSIGGSPAATITPYVSNDGIHWTATGTPVVFTTHSYWHTSSTVPGVSDTAVTVNTNPWTGKYIGLKVAVTSATQRAKYYITVKSYNNY
jgi:hypothetical protein